MSEKTTPIEAGAMAGPVAYTTAMIEAGVPHVWRHVAVTVVTAALDAVDLATFAPVLANIITGHVQELLDLPENAGAKPFTFDTAVTSGTIDILMDRFRTALLEGSDR